MRHFHKIKHHAEVSSINIDKISNIFFEKKKYKNEIVPLVDITHLGFIKLLGKGKTPTFPMIVKAKQFSKNAEKKIIKAGGKCILVP
mmetsp:Transcript_25619/g.63125  ORF Transcript_25619/g.63125 Transcript_25619/m.63125 type:complete len:87 (+) Transcript_25619:3643-3903(+)